VSAEDKVEVKEGELNDGAAKFKEENFMVSFLLDLGFESKLVMRRRGPCQIGRIHKHVNEG